MTQTRLSAARFLASAASVVFLALAPAAQADPLQDIGKQIKQGQHAQALEQIDKYLAGKPKDAQGRFLKGIVLTEMNKPNEAIAVFSKLTEDFPELPEPYNNLAVIYAQQKQFDKAKQALEMAIRTHPSYATAHENLGDIYARLASQAYDKALQIDSSNPTAQKKLALIRDLMGTGNRPGQSPSSRSAMRVRWNRSRSPKRRKPLPRRWQRRPPRRWLPRRPLHPPRHLRLPPRPSPPRSPNRSNPPNPPP